MQSIMITQGRMVEQAISAASQAAGAAASLVQAQAVMGRDITTVAAAVASAPQQVVHVVPTAVVPTAVPVPTPVVAAGKPAKLPENVSKAMTKSLAHYEKDLRKHMRNEVRITKSKAIVIMFEQDSSRSVYPVGVRPFFHCRRARRTRFSIDSGQFLRFCTSH
jgi:hypothetical protein